MKLQTRVALVPTFTVTLLAIGLYALISQVAVKSFTDLESEILHRQVQRVDNSVENLIDEHAQKIVDWAQWDNTYNFMQNLDQSYIDETLNPLTVGALGFNSVLYLDNDLGLKYGVTLKDSETIESVADALSDQIRQVIPKDHGSFKGLLTFNDHVFLIAAAPILPNKADQAARGMLVATSRFDEAKQGLIAKLTNLKVKFINPKQLEPGSISANAYQNLLGNTDFYVERVSAELGYAFGLVRGLDSKPTLLYSIEDPRRIVASSVEVRTLALVILSLAGIVGILLLAKVISFWVARRISLFSEQVRAIAQASDSSQRLKDSNIGARSIRIKTAASVFVVFMLTTVLTGVVFNKYFLRGFTAVEDQVMQDNLERATRALEGRLDKLKSKAIDWAQWDDSYQYIEDKNDDYTTANLGFDTLGGMKIKYVLYLDANNKIAVGKEVHQETESVENLSDEQRSKFEEALSTHIKSEPAAGFIRLPAETVLAAMSPILDTSRERPSKGTLIFAAAIDSLLKNDIGAQTRLNLGFSEATSQTKEGKQILRPSDDRIEGQSTIVDLANQPALVVSIKAPRPIFSQGVITASMLFIYFLIGGLLCTIVTLGWIDFVLISRVSKMGAEAAKIKESQQLDLRVSQSGSDEISGLAGHINSMLAALEKTQLDLADARAAAETANAAKSMFIARVSHELRTPVAGIIGLNNMLLKKKTESASTRELLGMQGAAAEGLLQIINEILDFSTVEQGKLSFESIDFDFRKVVKEALQVINGRLEGLANKSKVEILCELDPRVPTTLKGDPTKLKQVIVNLLGNSVKFTHAGYVGLRVTGSARPDGYTNLTIDVWDTGIGIARDKLASVFEPFKQADESVTRKYQGTGLGLTIVKQVVEGQGGTVSVTSVEGEGTTFTVSIPYLLATEESHRSHPLPRSALIIADKSRATDCLVKSLTQFGIEVRCESPSAGFSKVTHVADEFMVIAESVACEPRFEGEIVDRANQPGALTVVLLKPSQVELRERLHAAGVQHIVSTPFLVEDILNAYWISRGHKKSDHDQPPTIDSGLQSIRPLRVLVADDTPTNRIIVEELLSEAGHTVTCVGDGQQLVDKLMPMLKGQINAESFDLVLTDISMPIMDGYSATRAIRNLESERASPLHVPVVAVTAHVLGEEQEKMKQAGVDAVITKPIRAEALAAIFASLVKSA